jgi:hypothetical protein
MLFFYGAGATQFSARLFDDKVSAVRPSPPQAARGVFLAAYFQRG